jgi:hypothetical protein
MLESTESMDMRGNRSTDITFPPMRFGSRFFVLPIHGATSRGPMGARLRKNSERNGRKSNIQVNDALHPTETLHPAPNNR